jgi:sigma-E factor negative regulatory protein RseA
MSDPIDDGVAGRAVSALVDGEASADEALLVCSQWRDDPHARARWHRYQLIGDVMRSDDLAQAESGAAFLASFRERLAQEPVVLAPHAAVSREAPPVPASQSLVLRKRSWVGPVSVAAGFVLVVGALLNSALVPGGSVGVGTALSLAGQAHGTALGGFGTSSLDFSPSFVSLDVASDSASMSSGHVGGVTGSGASFSQPEAPVAMPANDPQADAIAPSRRSFAPAESFSGRISLMRPAVYAAP